MRLVTATFVNNEIEPGWLILDEAVPLGKQYQVDLDDVQAMTLGNRETGRSIPVACIYVVAPGRPGYLPLAAFRLEADA